MRAHSTRSPRRRATMYVLVVGCAALAAVIGISALMALRIERRGAESANDMAEARLYAQSAIELAMQRLAVDPNWRTSRANGAWETDRVLGAGTYSTTLVDAEDGDLDDSPGDAVVLTGIGRKGQARHMLQVTLTPELLPLEALNTCLHAAGTVTVGGGASITVSGAPLSSNGTVQNNNSIVGDVHALALSPTGSVTGTVTVPAPAKPLPDAGVFDLYKNKATAIPYLTTIEKTALGPTYNPWGPANPEGVYYIDTGSSDLILKGFRLQGTLVVKCGSGRSVMVDDAVFMEPHRSDYPVLIVDGDLELRLHSGDYDLLEANWLTNFNPAGAPYQSVSDTDVLDSYPNEIRGLVHAKRAVRLTQTARVKGVVLVESTVSCESTNEITHNPTLYQNPPEGYWSYGQLEIVPGTWRRVVD